MRQMLAVMAAAAVLATLTPEAHAQRGGATGQVDLSTPAGAVAAMRRIWCTETDGEPVYWFWRGDVYSRRQGERDRLLFRVEGLNTRSCTSVTDPTRGEGFRTVSRELLIYLDPETGEPLSRWTNPWTNETVDVLHVANDPVNGEFYERTRSGAPFSWSGSSIAGSWFLTSTIPLFYTNPLGGEFQEEVGGVYHATEMFNFMGDTASLTNRRLPTADVKVGWARISDWLPWMRMSGREGMVYFHTAGRKLMDWNQVSEVMRREVATHYPEYRNPPPGDDRRPNMTSWTYYEQVRSGAIEAPTRN